MGSQGRRRRWRGRRGHQFRSQQGTIMSIISEFKEFAVKGNMIDMAVGIVIGAAFGTVVSSLVDDIIMPPIGMLLSGVDFSNLEWVLKAADADGEGGVAISSDRNKEQS